MARFDSRSISINELRNVVEGAQAYGIKPDPSVAHGISIYDAIHERTSTAPKARILDLTEDEAVEHAFNIARTTAQGARGQGISAASTAATLIQDQLTQEVWEVLTADAPRIIKGLRPTFDAAAAHLTAAIDACARQVSETA